MKRIYFVRHIRHNFTRKAHDIFANYGHGAIRPEQFQVGQMAQFYFLQNRKKV